MALPAPTPVMERGRIYELPRRRATGMEDWLGTHEEAQGAVACPRIYIRALGDLKAAMFLSQVIYWQARTDDPEGWFWKSAAGWEEELALTKSEVKRCIRVLEPFGLVVKVATVHRSQTWHFHIDLPTLQTALDIALTRVKKLPCKSDKVQKAPVSDVSHGRKMHRDTGENLPVTREKNAPSLYTEITTETTPENTLALNAATASSAQVRGDAPKPRKRQQTRPSESKPRKQDPYWDALVTLCGPAEGRESLYGKTVQAIKAMGGLPDEIPIRAANWYRLYPKATRTINAIREHWHNLATESVDAELARQSEAQRARSPAQPPESKPHYKTFRRMGRSES